MNIQGRKYAPTTVCDVTLFNIRNGYPVMYFDTLKMTNIEGGAEITDIEGGRGNATLASIAHSKTGEISFEDAIMTMASLSVLTGGELKIADAENKIIMPHTEIVELESGDTDVVLSKNANEGSHVYIGKIIDGALGTVTRTSTALTTESASIAILDFNNFDSTEQAGRYRVFYEIAEGAPASGDAAEELTVLADRFAGTYRFIGDTVVYNQQYGSNDILQIEIPRLMLDGSYTFNLNAATEAVVFEFNGKSLRDDLGRMLVMRKLDGDATTNTQADGSIAATSNEVTIESDGTIV